MEKRYSFQVARSADNVTTFWKKEEDLEPEDRDLLLAELIHRFELTPAREQLRFVALLSDNKLSLNYQTIDMEEVEKILNITVKHL